MRVDQIKNTAQAPPQLIGILADALKIGATSFRLDAYSTHFMASFSAGSQAMEIDFEQWAGLEMLTYLVTKLQDSNARTGNFRLEYEGQKYKFKVSVDRRRSPNWIKVTWR